jgi:hypothetical protein
VKTLTVLHAPPNSLYLSLLPPTLVPTLTNTDLENKNETDTTLAVSSVLDR